MEQEQAVVMNFVRENVFLPRGVEANSHFGYPSQYLELKHEVSTTINI